MPEEKTKAEIHQEKVKEFKEKIEKKDRVSKKEIIDQIATRDILERDYKEDTVEVIFKSSPSTKRKLLCHKPTPNQLGEMMIFLSKPNSETTIKKFVELASELTLNKQLNEEFWGNRTSTNTLISFINELMMVAIQGPLSEGELDKFR